MIDEPTQEEIDAFFKRHAGEAYRDPTKDFWYMSPLCPSSELDAFEAIKQLHKELQQWVEGKKYGRSKRYVPKDIELWDAQTLLNKGHVYRDERAPVAQIAWLNGPENWPAILLQGRSYGSTFKSKGKEYYIEPADKQVLSLEFLRDLSQQEQYEEILRGFAQLQTLLKESKPQVGIGHNNPPTDLEDFLNQHDVTYIENLNIEIQSQGAAAPTTQTIQAAPSKLRSMRKAILAVLAACVLGGAGQVGKDVTAHYKLGEKICGVIDKLADDIEAWLDSVDEPTAVDVIAI